MSSKPSLLLCLLLAAFLLTRSAVSAKISIDEKEYVEASDQQANQVAHASTRGGCGFGGSYVTNKRGRIAQGSCRNGCCSWGPRRICRRCCSSAEEALNNKKN